MKTANNYERRLPPGIAMFLVGLVVLIVAGCATTTVTDTGKKEDFEMPPASKSKVVFLRPSDDGNILHFAVHDGERLVGRSSGSTYFTYECEPGQHVFSSSFGNVGILNADLLPDRIYYVKVMAVVRAFGPAWVKMIALYPGSGGIKWEQMPNILPKLTKSTITSEQVEHDLTGIDRYKERMKKYQDDPQFKKDIETILPQYGQPTALVLQ